MEIFERSRKLKPGLFSGKAVAYWMLRDKRAQDNWALLKAQEIALENRVPLLVCFQYNFKYEIVNSRSCSFLFEGLLDTEKRLKSLNIPLLLLKGPADITISSFLDNFHIGHLVVDYSPLKIHKTRLKKNFKPNHHTYYSSRCT